jgi:hypothetical protein
MGETNGANIGSNLHQAVMSLFVGRDSSPVWLHLQPAVTLLSFTRAEKLLPWLQRYLLQHLASSEEDGSLLS